MATKKKEQAPVAEKKLMKAVKGHLRTYTDGSPFVPTPRRPNDVILAEYKVKRTAALERHAKELAGIDGKIAYHQNRGSVDPAEAAATAKELLGEGMTPEQIDSLVKRLQTAKKGLAGKTPEEIAAMQAEALAAKAPVTFAPPAPEVPAFLQPAG